MELLTFPANRHPLPTFPALRRFKPHRLPRRLLRASSAVLRRPTSSGGEESRINGETTVSNDSASHLFDEMPSRKIPNYASTIASHCRSQQWADVLSAFVLMLNDDALPDKFLLPKILKACSETADLHFGTAVHGYMVRSRLELDVFVGNSLIDMYAKCGDLPAAQAVFDRMEARDVVSWTALVNAHADIGLMDDASRIFDSMRESGVIPDLISWNALISGFARNGAIDVALNLLDEMWESGLVPGANTWNGVISGSVQNGFFEDALVVFRRMCSHLNPNAVTIVSVLPACSVLEALHLGKELHCYVIRNGVRVNVFVGGSLIDMYLKCGESEYAERVFLKLKIRNVNVVNEMIGSYASNGRMTDALELLQLMMKDGLKPDIFTYNTLLAAYARNGEKVDAFDTLSSMKKMGLKPNVVSMNALISGFHQFGHGRDALELFRTIQLAEEGKLNSSYRPNGVTITSVLAVCTDLKMHHLGKEIHGYVLRHCFEFNVFVSSTLVDMYAKCGDMLSATKVFNGIGEKNIVSWNILMSGYNHNGDSDAALKLFPEMLEQGFIPNSITFLILLLACSNCTALKLGRELHAYVEKNRPDENLITLATALIDMYAKSGDIVQARMVFDQTNPKDLALWNVMISGYSLHRMAKDAISLFEQMEQFGINPDHITFIAILSACNQEGFADAGWKYFNIMESVYGVTPTLKHFTCMVDIMSRSGLLLQSLEFIERMPFQPDACMWSTLLKGCRLYANHEIGERAARALLELEPRNPSNYMLLYNIYAMGGMWDSAMNIRNTMRDRGLQIVKGCSSIYLGQTVHSFKAGDRLHPDMEKILDTWHSLSDEMKRAGYTPLDAVFDDEGEVDPFSCYHTEKLAVCLGIISENVPTPVCVSKNVRMCVDCHSSTKLISRITGRDIFVADGCCYHHFKNGSCNCGDKW